MEEDRPPDRRVPHKTGVILDHPENLNAGRVCAGVVGPRSRQIRIRLIDVNEKLLITERLYKEDTKSTEGRRNFGGVDV